MYAFAIAAANRNDEVKLSGAFAKLTDEDPALQVEQDRETHQTLLWGQGEMHLRVALDRLKNKYNVEVDAARRARPTARRSARRPTRTAATRSSPAATASSATSSSRSARSARGEGFQFENKVVGGAVPRQFIPAVEAGRASICSGAAGLSGGGRRVTLNDGQFHSVDSNELVVQAGDRAGAQGGACRSASRCCSSRS